MALALLGAYHVQRYAATQCVGARCDIYIPISLLLPLASWAATIVSGIFASVDARHSRWFAVLTACTLIGVVGPVVILVTLRDNPDATVVVGTLVLTLVPLVALVFGLVGGRRLQ